MLERQKDETKPTPVPPSRPLTRGAAPTMPGRQKCETKPTRPPPPRPLTRGAGRTMRGKQKYETNPKPPPTAAGPCPAQTCAAPPSDYSSFLVHHSSFPAAPRPLTRATGPTMPERQKCETKPTPLPPPRPLTRGAAPAMPGSQKYETNPKPPPTAAGPCPAQTCAAPPSDYSSFLVHHSSFPAAPRPLNRAAGPTMPQRQKSETKPPPVLPEAICPPAELHSPCLVVARRLRWEVKGNGRAGGSCRGRGRW